MGHAHRLLLSPLVLADQRRPVRPGLRSRHAPAIATDMHDIRLLRDDPAAFAAALQRRGTAFDAAAFADLDGRRRAAALAAETAQAERNRCRRRSARRSPPATGRAARRCRRRSPHSRTRSPPRKRATPSSGRRSTRCSRGSPTAPPPTCPKAPTRTATSSSSIGARRPISVSPPGSMTRSAARSAWISTPPAAVSGARFVYLKGPLARLNRALGQYMLDHQTQRARLYRGRPPLLVRDRGAVRHRPAAQIRRRPVPDHRRPLADPHRRGQPHQLCPRADPARADAAAALYRADQLLPRRGGRRGARHARDDPPAPVREGRAGLDRHPRAVRRRA